MHLTSRTRCVYTLCTVYSGFACVCVYTHDTQPIVVLITPYMEFRGRWRGGETTGAGSRAGGRENPRTAHPERDNNNKTHKHTRALALGILKINKKSRPLQAPRRQVPRPGPLLLANHGTSCQLSASKPCGLRGTARAAPPALELAVLTPVVRHLLNPTPIVNQWQWIDGSLCRVRRTSNSDPYM
jgi:hypothetical protein